MCCPPADIAQELEARGVLFRAWLPGKVVGIGLVGPANIAADLFIQRKRQDHCACFDRLSKAASNKYGGK